MVDFTYRGNTHTHTHMHTHTHTHSHTHNLYRSLALLNNNMIVWDYKECRMENMNPEVTDGNQSIGRKNLRGNLGKMDPRHVGLRGIH